MLLKAHFRYIAYKIGTNLSMINSIYILVAHTYELSNSNLNLKMYNNLNDTTYVLN